MGLLFCIKTAPNPRPEVSHSIVKVWEKSGKANTGGLEIANLRWLKACSALSVHEKEFFFNRVVKGAAI